MEMEEFDTAVASKISSRPGWFSGAEKPLDRAKIESSQEALGFNLPHEYLHFAERFGSGYFGSINISSLDSDSEWYRLDRPIKISEDRSLVVVSDDESGGYYGFMADRGVVGREVYYVNIDDGGQVEKISDTFWDFIMKMAFEF